MTETAERTNLPEYIMLRRSQRKIQQASQNISSSSRVAEISLKDELKYDNHPSATINRLKSLFKQPINMLAPWYHSVSKMMSSLVMKPPWYYFFIYSSVVICAFHLLPISDVENSSKPSLHPKERLTELKASCLQDDEFWKGVNSVLRTSAMGRISTILILHNGHESGANCLAVNVAKALSYVRANKNGKIYEVDGRELQESTFLESTNKYRDELGVVVFTHIEKFPSKVVQDLHFVCDGNPAKEVKAVLLFVFEVDDELSGDENYLTNIARKKMEVLWEADLKGRLDPIIARITDTVVSVRGVDDQCQKKLHCETN